ncbi:MAG TPA: STAS domain-containing protein [bacterium]|nr:STAS domain-containing protein [bacterium]
MLLEFHCQIDKDKRNITVTVLTPRLDATNSMDFEYGVIKYAEFYDIILDLKNVEYISSNAIGAIIQIYKITAKFTNSLKLENCSQKVKEIIGMAGLQNKLL